MVFCSQFVPKLVPNLFPVPEGFLGRCRQSRREAGTEGGILVETEELDVDVRQKNFGQNFFSGQQMSFVIKTSYLVIP